MPSEDGNTMDLSGKDKNNSTSRIADASRRIGGWQSVSA